MESGLKVFISYRRADLGGHAAGLVGRIYDRLASHYGGENVFMDVDTIPPGVRFDEYIDAAVAQADVLLAVVGNQWTEQMQARGGDENDYVRLEIESALGRSMPVVPLLIGGARMPQASDLPPSLGPFVLHNAYPVDTERDFNPHVTRLIADLDKHFGAQKEEGKEVAEVPAEVATAPVISVSEVETEEEERDGEFQLVDESELEPAFHPEPASQVLGNDQELPISEEVTGLGPEPEAVKRKGPPAWLATLGVLVMAGLLLGVWQPWKSGRDLVSSEEPKPGAAAHAKADEGKREAAPVSKAGTERRPPGEVPENYTNSRGIEMVWCPPGTFLMGSPEAEEDPSEGEEQHEVTLTKGFWIAATEVTQEQWEKVMGSNPSYFTSSGSQAPVERVSWDEAMEFCQKLTEAERKAGNLPAGEEYTLPTEAQWEYACRAGTTGPFNVEGASLEELGWYDENSNSRTHPVGQKKPNAWGLYDLHGNVWEWCLDWYDDYPEGPVSDPTGPAEQAEYRVIRGGSWFFSARSCRSARRFRDAPVNSSYILGFRPVRTLVQTVESETEPPSAIPQPEPEKKSSPQLSARSEEYCISSLGMEMVWCPPGTFLMGSPESEEDRGMGEEQHEVTLTKGFWIAATEVTQEQWEKVMGRNPSSFTSSGSQAPVESVRWNEAMEFCHKLTEAERKAGDLPAGEEYTLPTEAQWEYACRAVTTGRFNVEGTSLEELAWYDENSASKTQPVGQKKPNAWGLYDMHGNVYEWCLDWYDDYPEGPVTDPTGPAEYRVLRVSRGGSWLDDAGYCRSAYRDGFTPGVSNRYLGFRPVRSSR